MNAKDLKVERVLKDGVPEFGTINTEPDGYLGSKHVRKIVFHKHLVADKKTWYLGFAGCEMLVIMAPGYKDAICYSMPHLPPISGDCFTVVKRADDLNDDIRMS